MTKCQGGTIFAIQVTSCQVRTIGKVIRPFSQIRSHIGLVGYAKSHTRVAGIAQKR